ncbi:MAG: magnesium transporter [Actinomycetota bacterium]
MSTLTRAGVARARTIGALAERDVPVASVDASIREIRAGLRRSPPRRAPAVAVLKDGRMAGLLAVEALLSAPDETMASALMDPAPPRARPETDPEVAAWQVVNGLAHTVAVEDADGRFLGLVPPHALLAVLAAEHEEDLSRLGGSLHDTSEARISSRESIGRRLRHRLPWLIIGLAGAAASAVLVRSYEADLARAAVLAVFLPGIVYMADAVGTQTETIIIRGLSVGVSIREVVRRESATGLLIGLTLAALAFPFVLWWRADPDVAIAVALSLLAACSVASVVAMALPALFRRIGVDPAFGSGPLATVIQDLLSIMLYLWIATAIV